MGKDKEDYMQPLTDFPNIILHKGVYKSKNGNTEVTFSIEKYYINVMMLLTKIRWKWTGWAVFCEIWRQRDKIMKIQPYLDGMMALSPTDTKEQAVKKLRENFNATAGPTDWEKATPKGKDVLYCGGPNQNKKIEGWKGKGKGSDSIVKFTPDMWVTSDVAAAFGAGNASGPGVQKDEILFHEIVHGMRQMKGTMQCGATPDNPGLDTVEEFMAIVISNVYRSELNLPDLRADHHGFKKQHTDLNDPQKFIDKDKEKATSNYKRLLQLKSEHPELVNDLKRVPAKFNPFKLI